jgi:pimeloyl-ACP methyl ester carboxylesterase
MELAHHRTGAGDPLVLVHGTGSQWQAFRPVLEPLAARRDVIAPDLPGFGASPPLPAAAPHTPRAFAEAVAGLLDGLGLRDAHVAGPSRLRPRPVLRRPAIARTGDPGRSAG